MSNFKINKADFSEESNISESLFKIDDAPILVSDSNPSESLMSLDLKSKPIKNKHLTKTKSSTSRGMATKKTNRILEEPSREVQIPSTVLSYSSASTSLSDLASNEPFSYKKAPKQQQKDVKLKNQAVVIVKKLSNEEIKQHTQKEERVKITICKNKDSNNYNIKPVKTLFKQIVQLQTDSESVESESVESESDFIFTKVRKPKKKENNSLSNLVTILTKETENKTITTPAIPKPKPETPKQLINKPDTIEPNKNEELSKQKFKIPKLAKVIQSPVKATVATTSTTKPNLKKSNESLKKSIKVLNSTDSSKRLKKSPIKDSHKSKKNESKKESPVKKDKRPSRTKPTQTKQPILSLIETVEPKAVKPNNQISATSPALTLSMLNEKRLQYNKANGWDHPLYSLTFLVNDYLQAASKQGGSLDFNLLNAQIEKTNDPLCVSQLNNEERLELCKLMSRSAGRLNKYSLYGIDATLRENTHNFNIDFKKYGKHADNLKNGLPLEFANEAEEDQFLTTELPKLTLAESFAVYEHFAEKLTSPWRKIKFFYGKNFNLKLLKLF